MKPLLLEKEVVTLLQDQDPSLVDRHVFGKKTECVGEAADCAVCRPGRLLPMEKVIGRPLRRRRSPFDAPSALLVVCCL